MKKAVSILLCVCTVLSVLMLSACGHECTLADGWRNDTSSHWHVCTDPDCDKQADLANHTWDKGEITKRATQEAAGVKTFTCTECQYKKTQNVSFTGMTEEEWYAALAQDLFINFTYTEKTSVRISGAEAVTTTVYEFENGGKARITETAPGQQKTSAMIPAENISTIRQALWAYCALMADYEDYYYESKTKSYKQKGVFNIPLYEVPADTAVIKFKNGKLSEIIYTCKFIEEGQTYYISTTITFTNFDTTVIQ